MRVIVTRPAAQAQAWVPRLQALGVDAVSLPLLGIEPAPDSDAVRAAWALVPGAALVMFVSANAVSHFFAWQPAGAPWPTTALAGSTGPGTSAALRQAGVPAQRIAEPDGAGPFDTEALWRRIAGLEWDGRHVLVVRGEGGRDWLADQLRAAGARVSFVAAYRRVAPDLRGPAAALMQAALRQPAGHCWHFSSSQAIEHLRQAWAGADWSASQALATHVRIAEAARRAGFGRVDTVGVHPADVAAWLQQGPRDAGPREGGR
ncbi:MAG: uroporphyrinogen-III synthase HemD [Pseudomonadota bacterium]|jgi:uroporphyrinogen-III synthase